MTFITEETQQWLDTKCAARANMVNVWECKNCSHKLVVIHKDTGVTPMFISHNPDHGGDETCAGQMVSWGYPPIAALEYHPTHEFYRPSPSEYDKLESEPMKAHLRDGGLILRKLP